MHPENISHPVQEPSRAAADIGEHALSMTMELSQAEAMQEVTYLAVLEEPVREPSRFGGEAVFLQARAVDAANREQADTIPVYFAGGYGGVKPAPYLVDLAKHGRSAFTVSLQGRRENDTSFLALSQTERGKETEGLSGRQVMKLPARPEERLPDVVVSRHQMKKSATLLAEMEAQSITKTDALLQSEGAIHGLLAAYTAPEKFDRIVLAYPAGIDGPNTPGSILRSSMKHARDVRRARRASTAETNFKDDLGGNTTREGGDRTPNALIDAASVVYTDQSALLHALRQKEHSPDIALIAGMDDPIYPPERYIKELRSSDDVDIVLITDGKHGIGYDREIMAQATGLYEKLDELKALREVAREQGRDGRLPLRDRIILAHGISEEYASKLYALADEVDARSQNRGI